MRLYELAEELLACEELLTEWAIEHEGDVTDFPLNEELEKLGLDREKLVLKVGAWRKTYLTESTGYKGEIKTLQKKAKVSDNKADRLLGFLEYILEVGEKFKDSKCDIGWRKSSRLIVDVPVEGLPAEYVRVSMEPDKTSLKELVKSNTECAFAHMEEHYNLQVK